MTLKLPHNKCLNYNPSLGEKKLEIKPLYIRVIHEAPQIGGTGTQFCQKWGWKKTSGWKEYTREKKQEETKLVFSPKLILTGIWFALPAPAPAPALLLIFFINSSLVKIKCCNSLELVPSFINRYPVSHTSWLHKLGMKQALQGQTRDQRPSY